MVVGRAGGGIETLRVGQIGALFMLDLPLRRSINPTLKTSLRGSPVWEGREVIPPHRTRKHVW